MPFEDFEVFNFVAPTSGTPTIAQALTIPNARGEVPKGYLMIVSGAAALDAGANNARISIGADDGTTQRAVGIMLEHNVATASADTGYRVDVDTVVQMPNTTGPSLQVEAARTSLGVDTINLGWSATTAGLEGTVLAFYGSDVVVDVQSVAAANSINGTVDVTMSKLPDAVILFGVGQAFVADGQGSPAMLTFGFAARSSGTQACSCLCAESRAAAATSVGNIERDDCAATHLVSTAGVVTEGARIAVSFPNATGCRLTTLNLALSEEVIVVQLYLGGAQCWAGAPVVNTDTLGSTGSITNPAIKGKAIIASAARIASAVNTLIDTFAVMSVGWAARLGNQGCAALRSTDNAATSVSQSIASNTRLVDILTSTSAHDYYVEFVSFDRNSPPGTPSGFTLNIGDASAAGNDRPIPMLVLGEAREGVAFPQRRHRQGGTKRVKASEGTAFGKRNSVPGNQARRDKAGGRPSRVRPGDGTVLNARHNVPQAQRARSTLAARVRSAVHHVARALGARHAGAALARAARASARMARHRPSTTHAPGGSTVRRGMGPLLKLFTRFRLARLRRLRWKPEPEVLIEPPAEPVGIPASPRGSNAMAGSVEGDTSSGGSARGSTT